MQLICTQLPQARQLDASSSLTVSAPGTAPAPPIARDIDHTDALFGIPLYRGSLNGPIVDISLLSDMEGNADGCDPYQLPSAAPPDTILLIDRIQSAGTHNSRFNHNSADLESLEASIMLQKVSQLQLVPTSARSPASGPTINTTLAQDIPQPRCTFARRV